MSVLSSLLPEAVLSEPDVLPPPPPQDTRLMLTIAKKAPATRERLMLKECNFICFTCGS
jgi:hypothetical protein